MNGLQERWLDRAVENSDRLNDWEQEFVFTLVEKGDDYELSGLQNAVLNRIISKLDGY